MPKVNPPNRFVGPMALRHLRPRQPQYVLTEQITPRHGWLSIQLARPPRMSRRVHSLFTGPGIVTPRFIASPVKVTLVRAPRPGFVLAQVQVPTVVNPAPPVDAQLHITLAGRKSPHRPGKYSLKSPVVVNPAPPIVTTLRVTLAGSKSPRRPGKSRLFPPTVVTQGQPPVVTTIRVSLANGKRPSRGTLFILGAPQFVTPQVFPPVVTKIRTVLVRTPLPNRGQGYVLAAPAIVNLPPVAPISVKLSVHLFGSLRPHTIPLQRYFIRLPQVVSLPTPIIGRPLKVTLAVGAALKPRTLSRQQSLLSTPTVVGPDISTPRPQTPTITGNFIDRREKRTERRELFTRGRRS